MDRGRENEAATAERIARIFRKRITWIEAKGDFEVNGVTLPSIQGTILIDVHTEKMVYTVMGHELSRHLGQENAESLCRQVDAF
ncbi:MAG: hypothetical protein LV471_10095 [Nitrosomonas sp.]|nr:hypothetical protein [Nitrosomonas sp.]